jgi:hypothetical protein
MQARRRCTFFLVFLPLLLCATGCRNRTDLVENELRNRDQMYRDALTDKQTSDLRLEALMRENEALRKGTTISPEQSAQTFGLRRIVLGRSTGGYDKDNLPGDELLQVVVEPRDESDHTLKSPGTLFILTLEITPQGVKVPLSSWEIPPEELRQSWKQGLLSTGYTLLLPWKNFPQYETVRVIVRFVTPDQRAFESDKDVKVRVVPGAARQRCEPYPYTLPAPRPLPPAEVGPAPMDKLTPSSWLPAAPETTPPQPTQWRCTSLEKSVTIGRPEAMNTPAAPPSIQDILKQ